MSDTAQPFTEWAIVEQWRPAVGFKDIYEVSDLGRVRRSGKAARNGKGRGGGARIGRLLKLAPAPGGYLKAQLWSNGRPRPKLIHVLVAAAFIGPAPEGHEVNHCDGNKSNNRVGNLEYLTRSENNRHAYRIGLRVAAVRTGESHHNAKLTAEQVAEIKRLYVPRRYGTPRLAREFGVNHKTIHAIVSGKNWKEVQAA